MGIVSNVSKVRREGSNQGRAGQCSKDKTCMLRCVTLCCEDEIYVVVGWLIG